MTSDHNLPNVPPEFTLTGQRPALVVIDMQRCYVDPDCGLGRILSEDYPAIASTYFQALRDYVLPNQKRLLETFRQRGLECVFVTQGPRTGDARDMTRPRRVRECQRRDRLGLNRLFMPGTDGHQVHHDIAPQPDELVLNKNTSNAFVSTSLDQFLRNTGSGPVVFCGVQTMVCVESSVRTAADLGYDCVVAEDASTSYAVEAHEASLRVMERFFARRMSTEEILDELSAPAQ